MTRPVDKTHSENKISGQTDGNEAGQLFIIVNCVDAWMIALELDQCVFTSLYLNLHCISGYRYPNERR